MILQCFIGWNVGLRAGSFTPYLQVYLGNRTRVAGVTVHNQGSCNATSVGLTYSDDGVQWDTHPQSVKLARI